MAKIVAAVSGGVDSMVMLDLLCRQYASNEYSFCDIIVAHYDHNIRPNSGEDADFVRRVSENIYHVANISQEMQSSRDVSEETARRARYDFLERVAEENAAIIYTAHHLDDLVETIAINLIRGTGWRGLACLDRPGVKRPLLETEFVYEPMDKAAIFEYAAKCGLHFREDQTNSSDDYLRNRVRHQMNIGYEQKIKLYDLWRRQKQLKREIDDTIQQLLPDEQTEWQRSWFKELEPQVALALLRAGTLRAGIRATRPQLENFRQAILTYAPGKSFNLPGDKLIRFTKTTFSML